MTGKIFIIKQKKNFDFNTNMRYEGLMQPWISHEIIIIIRRKYEKYKYIHLFYKLDSHTNIHTHIIITC